MEQHEAKQQYEAKPLQFGLRTALLAVAGVSVWLAGMTNEHLRPWLSVVNFVLLGIVNHYAVDFVCRRVQAFAAGKYSAQFSGALTAVVGSVGALCWGTFLMLAVYDNYDLPFGFLLMSLTVAPVLFFSALVISCLSLIVLTDLTRRKYRDLPAVFLSLLTGALIGGVLFSVYLVVSCVLLDRLDAITDASPYVAAFGAVIGLIFGSRGIHYHFDLRDEAIRRRLAVRPLGVR